VITRRRQSLVAGRALLVLLALFSPVALAAPGQEGAAGMFDSAYIFQVLASLVLVFGCIFGLIFLLRKLNGLPMASGAPIRVLASARVGTREKIILLEAGDQQLLVGVAAGSVRALHVFDRPAVGEATTPARAGDFASVLQASAPGRGVR